MLCQLSYTHRMQFRGPRKVDLALARLKGFEPLTYCLEGSCSIHLSYRRVSCALRGPRKAALQALRLAPTLERVMGIEPTRPAWKAGILPLNYTRKRCLRKRQLEHGTTNPAACQSLQNKKREVLFLPPGFGIIIYL